MKNSNIVVAEEYMDLKKTSGVGVIEIPSIVKEGENITLMLFIENQEADITGAAKAHL
ncbi:hypothetical protein [Maribacter litoralis]|uniref:hypothetical protein n=1 Tax=Maribacter litoralis TaxID=2059726 RepID=UPI003F5CEA3C